MAAVADTSVSRYDSSPGELSSPPSGSLSEPGSPSRRPAARGRNNMDEMEIVVGNEKRAGAGSGAPGALGIQSASAPSTPSQNQNIPPMPPQPLHGPLKRWGFVDGQWVQLTAAGVPRKKPGRKPGTVVRPKNPDGSDAKPRKQRKPLSASITRKRKLAPATDVTDMEAIIRDSQQPRISDVSNLSASSPSHHHHHHQQPSQQQQPEQRYSPKMPKREHFSNSMQSILNSDPPSQPQPSNTTTVPLRTSGQSYDPIRGKSYDPIRETMSPHNPYGSTSTSPRAPPQVPNRSPTIASLLEPAASAHATPSLPKQSHSYNSAPPTQSRMHGSDSVPPSPSQQGRTTATATPTPASRSAAQDSKQEGNKNPPPPPPPPVVHRPIPKESQFTTIANGPIKKVSPKQKPHTGVSTPRTDNLDEMPDMEGRSILDFGKAKPGEETQAPTIMLEIPIQKGETNRYVNFMRLAEDRYGWDALHPRLAANRDRKARIAAAAASLEKVDSGRESGDEMSVDLSDAEVSNADNGGTSNPDAQAKPKKKRNFKEDQYDVDDDFVDDSEMLWEAQAAASRDGFFVYSGPLVPEVEKPPAGQEGPPKRGRGGRGSRGGGRGASTRGGTGSGRGGGPGSRGGSITRKPRITKSEKLQREREKAERESLAQLVKTPSNGNISMQPTTPSFAVSEA